MLAINRPSNYIFKTVSRYFCVSSSSIIPVDSDQISPLTQPNELSSDFKHEPVFETLIGLSVSCRLNVSSKLFSRSPTAYFARPNENVSFFDASLPATLPIVNRSCLELAIKSALALHCQISPVCSFDREHSFNPVNPFGYRLVQSRRPLASNGYLQVPIFLHSKDSGVLKTIECQSIHLEEDSGSASPNHLDQFLGINLNSHGLPLIKFVFKPSNVTPKESRCLVNELLLVLKRIGATNNRMEERTLSIDATIQLTCDSNPCNPVTIKGCNSPAILADHLAHEIGRTKSLLKNSQSVPDNRLLLGSLTGGLKPIKSTDYDARFLVEPSIPPFIFLDSDQTEDESTSISLVKLSAEMPMLPNEERSILMDRYGLSLRQALQLVENNYSKIFIEIMSTDESINSELLFSFIMNVLEKAVMLTSEENGQFLHFIDLLVKCYHLYENNKIVRPIAVKMICGWLEGNRQSPQELLEINDWFTIEDDSVIEEYCKKVIIDRCTIVFLVKRGEKRFLFNLAHRVKIASNHRIPTEKIITKLEQLIKSIDRLTLGTFVSTRTKISVNRPKLFNDDN